MSTNEGVSGTVEKPIVEVPSSSTAAVSVDKSDVAASPASPPIENPSEVIHKTDLQRMLAEVNFIYGEVNFHLA